MAPLTRLTGWIRRRRTVPSPAIPSIGLALGGGFARGIAHIGVLRVLEEAQVPIHCIAGVSAGAMVAAAYASGTSLDELTAFAKLMKFKNIARWTVSRLGFLTNERMTSFLKRLLKVHTFEQMRVPLAVAATHINDGEPVVFRNGDVIPPIRASCAYPGMFLPIRYRDHYLVDGAIAMEVPAAPMREMGANRVISVFLPTQVPVVDPRNMFEVVNRCFQVMHARTETEWRQHSDLVIAPQVCGMSWDCFQSSEQLIQAGEQAAQAALPQIRSWLAAGKIAA